MKKIMSGTGGSYYQLADLLPAARNRKETIGGTGDSY